MGNDRHVDCLIVGQGLAGTCLAFELFRRKKRFVVIDRDAGAHCSAVAAGTFNPVSFRTLSPVWMAGTLVPYLRKFYAEMGQLIHSELLVQREVHRRFRKPEDRAAWDQRLEEFPAIRQFIAESYEGPIGGVENHAGFGRVMNAGTLRIREMLKGFREHLIKNGSLFPGDFLSGEWELAANEIRGHRIIADFLVFCQGQEGGDHPFFRELPFRRTKGEALIIKAPALERTHIIHDGINIVPLSEDVFWVGSTFDWNDMQMGATIKARQQLEEKLRYLINVPYEILEQHAGIRPTVKDRRPLLGCHPDHLRVAIFNGLGTRGVMLAPYFAGHLADHLFEGKALHPEVDIRRFISAK